MDDYAIKVSNLPPISFYKGDEHVLKAKLLWHFHDLFLSEIEIEWEAAVEQYKENLREQPQIEIKENHLERLNERVKARLEDLQPFDYSAISPDHLPNASDVLQRTIEESSWVYFGDNHFFTRSKEGKGYMVFEDGAIYEGCWKNNTQSGLGRLIEADGGIYFGNWKRGQFHGRGAHLWYSEGQEYKYKGSFK